MNNIHKSGFIFLFVLFVYSCSSIPERPWSDAISEEAPFIIIPEENATLQSVLGSTYTPFLDDITSSAVQLISRVDSVSTASLSLKSIVLYPGAGNRLQTVWFTEAPESLLSTLQETFYEEFSQNNYNFHDVVIHKLNIYDRILFAVRLNDALLFSESSLGIEDAVRTYLDRKPRARLSDLQLEPGSIVMNTPALDGWLQQLALAMYRPIIIGALQGTEPALLSVSQEGEQLNREFRMSGTIPLVEDSKTELVASFSSKNAPISLDQYISSNVAGFALMRATPNPAPPVSTPDTTELDAALMDEQTRYARLARSLGDEFGIAMYTESGFLSTGEHLFLRKVNDVSAVREQLNELEADSLIEPTDGLYFVRSGVLARMIGGEMCTFDSFYLDLTGDVLVISKRRGLTEMVESDHNRRRVISYESEYRALKEELPNEISGLFVANTDFYSFIHPFLKADNYVDAITRRFDLLTVSTALDETNESLSFNIKTYQTTDRSAPYEEKWLVPTDNSGLTGEPILADIGGSSREEIIFATESGKVYALAADGTVALEVNTGNDTPIGSPVVYDWYGTNQNVILIAASNKIYGWNENGELLPQFPFTVNEQITTPLVIADITRNGLPEALIATADRSLHMLNNRGNDVDGWPVTTNTVIQSKPAVALFGGSHSILSFASNAVHAWEVDGSPKENFPKFLNASINGSPLVYKENILAGAADGYLYSIGPNKLFADSLDTFNSSSETNDIEAAYVSDNALTGTPSVHELSLQSGEQNYNESMILTMSSNGSVFLISESGQLLFNKNMGQPSAAEFSPFITDLNSDGGLDLISLANFGRLYAWQISNGERIYSLPTTGMENVVVADIDNDGYQEVIAQTNRGLRCWTIYGE